MLTAVKTAKKTCNIKDMARFGQWNERLGGSLETQCSKWLKSLTLLCNFDVLTAVNIARPREAL